MAQALSAASGLPSADSLVDTFEMGFTRLSKTGKPQAFEWTMGAAVIVEMAGSTGAPALEVVAVGTGNKCIGRGNLRAGGLLVHDCHAEILAVRAFRTLLLEEVLWHAAHCQCPGHDTQRACDYGLLSHGHTDKDGILHPSSFKLREAVKGLHLYISDSPCGDAQLYEDAGHVDSEPAGAGEDGSILLVNACASEPPESRGCSGGGTGSSGGRRSGAKEVSSNASAGCSLRIKSGRSDLPPSKLTHSMSCSDKLCRLAALGITGGLLASLGLEGLFFSSITVSAEQAAWLRVVEGSHPTLPQTSASLEATLLTPAAAGDDDAASQSRWALKQTGASEAIPGLRNQLNALCRAVVARALPNIFAAQKHLMQSGEAVNLNVPVLRVTSRVFSACRAATIAARMLDGSSTADSSEPSAKRPRLDADSKDGGGEGGGAGSNKFLALSGGSGSKAPVVPCGSAIAAWRDWSSFKAAPTNVSRHPGLRLPASFTSDGLTASTGTPLGVAPKALEKSPVVAMQGVDIASSSAASSSSNVATAASVSYDKPAVGGSRVSRFSMARLFLRAAQALGLDIQAPAGTTGGQLVSYDACKGKIKTAGGTTAAGSSPYQLAWNAFLSAGDGSFERGWVHLPDSGSSSGSDYAVAGAGSSSAATVNLRDFVIPLPLLAVACSK